MAKFRYVIQTETYKLDCFDSASAIPPGISRVFVCSICGKVWGRVYGEAPGWSVFSRPCLDHGDGSLKWLHNLTLEEVYELPREVLIYALLTFKENAEG